MSQTFNCPNCGAPLDFPGSGVATVRCPYCASTVMLPQAPAGSQAGLPSRAAVASIDLRWLTGTLQEIAALLSEGRKIEAIKLYRQRFDVGLKEAKDSVEQIERGEPLHLSRIVVARKDMASQDLPAVEAELQRLLHDGEKIEAIKFYRETFGAGLVDSKEAVESFENGGVLRIPDGWSQTGRPADMDAVIPLSEIARLAQQGDRLAAEQLYRESFDSSLQEAQSVVERLAQDPDSDPLWIVATVRSGLDASRLSPLTGTEGTVKRVSCLYASLSLLVIGSIVFGLLAGLVQAFAPLKTTWERINPGAYARPVLSFGGQGTGPGLFSDPRAIAADSDGRIYVGDYLDGRIQRFDSSGRFLNQWFTQEESYLGSLAVDRSGIVYAPYKGQIWRFTGESGEPLGALPNLEDLYYEYAVVAPDGSLVAVSNGEDLVRLDRDGQVQWLLPEAISSISGDAELDARLAVDGLGYIYALGIFNSAVFKFSPEGRYINRWGSSGDQPGQFSAANAIATDGYGRVFVSDMFGVQVFDGQDGRYIDSFDVPGVVFGMAFDDQNDLYAISNDRKVYRYRLQPLKPTVQEAKPLVMQVD